MILIPNGGFVTHATDNAGLYHAWDIGSEYDAHIAFRVTPDGHITVMDHEVWPHGG